MRQGANLQLTVRNLLTGFTICWELVSGRWNVEEDCSTHEALNVPYPT